MKTLRVGEIAITSLIERDGPWRTPEVMFPAYDPEIGRRRLAELDPIVFDSASGRMVITYQTFLVRTPRHTVLTTPAPERTKATRPHTTFPSSPGSTICTPRACAWKTSRTSSARICISTTPAGIRCFAMADGRRRFRTRSTSFIRTSTLRGRR
jgi:hypothetical protein